MNSHKKDVAFLQCLFCCSNLSDYIYFCLSFTTNNSLINRCTCLLFILVNCFISLLDRVRNYFFTISSFRQVSLLLGETNPALPIYTVILINRLVNVESTNQSSKKRIGHRYDIQFPFLFLC
jgi:hypothetical protein